MNIDLIFQNVASKFLKEAALDRTEIKKYRWRIERFIDFIKNGKAFKSLEGNQINEVVITLNIYDRFTKKLVSQQSNLDNEDDLDRFNTWLSYTTSEFIIKPVWDGKEHPWSQIYKDAKNFQYVNSSSGGIINEKELTPAGLGIEKRAITITSLLELINNIVDERFDRVISAVLKGLLEAASHSTNNAVAIDPKLSELFSSLDIADRRRIVKDFGEILSSIIVAKNYEGYTMIKYSEQNERLIDFILRNPRSGGEIKFSAKGLSGSGSTVTNYKEGLLAIENDQYFTNRQRKIAKILKSFYPETLHGAVMNLALSGIFSDNSLVTTTIKKLKTTLNLENTEDKEQIAQDKTAASIENLHHDPKYDEAIYSAAINTKTGKLSDLASKYLKNNLPVDKKAVSRLSNEMNDLNTSRDFVKSIFIYPVLRACLIEMNEADSDFKKVAAAAIGRTQFSQATINFNSLTNPTSLTVAIHESHETDASNVKFTTKASLQSFKGGGIGITIDP